MKKLVPVLLGLFFITAVFTIVQSGDSSDEFTYLPMVLEDVTNETATPTATLEPTYTPIPTPTPTNTPAPPVSSGDVRIIDIFYDGVVSSQEPDEYVEIRNFDTSPVQLEGWTLRDSNGASPKTFTFPEFVLEPGQTCRVYTNEIHPIWCGFSFNNSAAIWNNGGDCGTLRNQAGMEIHTYCY